MNLSVNSTKPELPFLMVLADRKRTVATTKLAIAPTMMANRAKDVAVDDSAIAVANRVAEQPTRAQPPESKRCDSLPH
jgi:hypothetical protein